MSEITYLARLEPAEDGGYALLFPDLPGCVASGVDREAALGSGEASLLAHLRDLTRVGHPLPKPSKMAALHRAEEARSGQTKGVWALVTVHAADVTLATP